jgi:predicted permease
MTDRLRLDVLSALRAFGRSPGTVAATVLTLAVAAGLNLAMFGLIDRAVLSPPAHVADPDRVFTLGFERELEDGSRPVMTTTSYPTFEAIRANVPSATAAAWQRDATNALVGDTPVNADVMLVSGAYFELLGARPLLGRTLAPADDAPPAGAPVAVVSHAFWKGVLRGSPDALDRRLTVRGIELTVVGVMPPGFSGHSATKVDVWVPFHTAMQQSPGWDTQRLRNIAAIVVRVTNGQSPAATSAQASAAAEDGRRVTLTPIRGASVAPADQRIAYWLTGVSVLVLVIGLANAATLLLVRGAGRRRDLAIRAALGATRSRLRSQLTIEAALLAATAVSAALLLALWFDDAVRTVLLPSLVPAASMNGRTIAAAGIAGVLTFAFATAAGWAQMRDALRTEDLSAGRSRSRRHAHTVLLLVQTTLSVVLLAGAGLFGRSLYNLVSQDFGMRMDDVLLVEFDRGPGAERGQLLASAVERIRALPGVELATPIQMIPFTGFHVIPIAVPGLPNPPNVDGQLPYLFAATPELLEILGVSMVEGRRFGESDDRGAPVIIVNETLARTAWPGESALGKCIRIGFEPSFDPFTASGPPPPLTTVPCREVIGVTRNIRQRSVVPSGNEARLMQYFVPFSQVPTASGQGPGVQGLLLRSAAGPESLAAPIRQIVLNGRTDLPFLHVRRYSDLLERQMRPWRQGAALLALFGALALAVAAVGLYAAFAHSVGERRRELAIRLAIGARAQGVLLMILREAAAVAAAGVVFGGILAIVGGRWLGSMLFGTAPSDPLVLGSAALVRIVVSTIATFVPARRASKTDPSTLLRAE